MGVASECQISLPEAGAHAYHARFSEWKGADELTYPESARSHFSGSFGAILATITRNATATLRSLGDWSNGFIVSRGRAD
jgi:hypothetical protein